jgi:predicted HTH transcriptional regulator
VPQARKSNSGSDGGIGSQIASLTNSLTAIDTQITEDEAKLSELRRERSNIARQIQAILSPLLGTTAAPSTARRGGSTGPRVDPAEREAQALAIVQANPGGITAKGVADELGVSSATATKVVNSLLESNQIVSTGERRSRRLLPA